MNLNDKSVNPTIQAYVNSLNDIIVDRYSDEGGAELYFGYHTIFKERVALKFYHVDSDGLAHEEPQLLRSIEHKNVLKVYDAKSIGTKFALMITPEITGGTLQELIDNQSLSTHQAIELIRDVLLGLTELHKPSNRIVHRDLKPNNIFVKNPGYSIIGDLGSARQIGNNADSTSSSKFTRMYRSPESVEEKIHSFQSDIYQVGLILFQLLGGDFPENYYEWLNAKERSRLAKVADINERDQLESQLIDEKIVKGKLLNYNSLPFFVNNRLLSIIKTATNPDLNKRFKSAVEFLNALYKYKNNSKSWQLDLSSSQYTATFNDKEYRIIPHKKGFLAQKRQKDGNWRKIINKTCTIEEAGIIIDNS